MLNRLTLRRASSGEADTHQLDAGDLRAGPAATSQRTRAPLGFLGVAVPYEMLRDEVQARNGAAASSAPMPDGS